MQSVLSVLNAYGALHRANVAASTIQQMACTVFHGIVIDAMVLFNITHIHK